VRFQPIYNTVGGKAAVLKAVYDTMLAGDDEPVPIMLAESGAGDAAVRAFVATIENERAAGTAMIAGLARERFGLRDGLSVDAADILWTLTAPEIPIRLVHRRGWSLDAYEGWIADTMAHALLNPSRDDATR
jgi:hypothetical protein